MESNPPAVKTTIELSEYLKISRSTLYKAVHARKITSEKVEHHWRIRESGHSRVA